MEDDKETYEELERRALFDMPDNETDEPAPDLLGALRDDAGAETAALDMTLGGYIDEHNRVPAFEGADGQPYTVDIDIEESAEGFAAFLVFIRWAETGAGIMDHVESGDIARGGTEQEARNGALDLSLYEVKAELDAAIMRRAREMEE